MQNKDANMKLSRFLLAKKMHILRSRIFLCFVFFFNSCLKNTGSLGGNWFLKIAVSPYPSQYCNNFKKNFSELRIIFFKGTELSGLFFLWKEETWILATDWYTWRLDFVQPVCVIGKSIKVVFVTFGSWFWFLRCVGEESIYKSFKVGEMVHF